MGEMLTKREVAGALRVSLKTLAGLLHSGRLPYVTVSQKKVVIPRAAVESYVAANTVVGKENK